MDNSGAEWRSDTRVCLMTAENMSKLERLNKLREDARLLEMELQQDMENVPAGSPKQLSNANTPRGKTGMTASRPPLRTKAAAASTQRVSKLLKDQIRSNYNTIQLLFNRNDTQNTGKVDSRELLNVMARCNVPMTEHQAGEIVALLDPDDHGRINYRDFLAIFYVQMPSLDGGKSRPISSMHPASAGLPAVSRMHTPLVTAKGEGARPFTKSAKANPNFRDRPTTGMRTSLVYGGNLSATRIALIAQLNEFVGDNMQKLMEMFEMSDMDDGGKVSKYETVRIFIAAGFPVTIEEMNDILDVLAQKTPKGYVDYKATLKKLRSLTFDMPEIFESLTSVQFAPTHLTHVVGCRIRDAYINVLECLREENSEGNGMVSQLAMLRILKGAGLEISLQAFTEVLRATGVTTQTSSTTGTTYLNAHHLIQRFVPSHRPPSVGRHAELAERSRVPKEIFSGPSMNPDQLLEKLKEKMEDHIKYPREMFLKLDTDRDGTLTKEELAPAFLHFNLYPKPSDVDALFDAVDVHKKGRIGYKEFLTMLVPHGDNKPSMFHDSFKSYMRKGSFYSLVPQGVAPIRLGSQGKFTPVGKLSLTDIQQVIKKKIGNQINSFLALLKQRDPDGTGFLSKSLLLQVLRKLDVFITFPQLEEVLEAAGVGSYGDKVKHNEIISKLLSTNPGQAAEGSQTHRPFNATQVPVDRTELLDRIRTKLRGRYEDVQKAFFEEQDQALDFKVGREEVARILSRFGVPITQDQGKVLFESLGETLDYLEFLKLLDLGSRLPTAGRLPTANLARKGVQVEIVSPSRHGTRSSVRALKP